MENKHADRAWLISAGPISPDARALINASRHLECFTHAEFQRRLLDLNSYIRDLMAECKRERLTDFYIPSKTRDGDDLATVVENWMAEDGAEPLAILAGYGIGKSTFAKHFAAQLGKIALTDFAVRVPVLVP